MHTHIHILHSTGFTLVGKRNKEKCDNSECLVSRKHIRVSFWARVPLVPQPWLRGMTVLATDNLTSDSLCFQTDAIDV